MLDLPHERLEAVLRNGGAYEFRIAVTLPEIGYEHC